MKELRNGQTVLLFCLLRHLNVTRYQSFSISSPGAGRVSRAQTLAEVESAAVERSDRAEWTVAARDSNLSSSRSPGTRPVLCIDNIIQHNGLSAPQPRVAVVAESCNINQPILRECMLHGKVWRKCGQVGNGGNICRCGTSPPSNPILCLSLQRKFMVASIKT